MPASSLPSQYDPAATRRWVERLARFRPGRQTVAAFCAAEGVSEANFYLWRRRLAPPPAAVPSAPAAVPSAPAVVPLRVAPPPAPAAPIELALPSGGVLRFPADTRPERIAAVVRGLEGRPC